MLKGTIFFNADLRGVNFRAANFIETDLSIATIGLTIFGGNDLSTIKGLDTIEHRGPSIIGIDSIYLSKGGISEVFLRGAGVPDNFIDYIGSLTGKAFEFYSCF